MITKKERATLRAKAGEENRYYPIDFVLRLLDDLEAAEARVVQLEGLISAKSIALQNANTRAERAETERNLLAEFISENFSTQHGCPNDFDECPQPVDVCLCADVRGIPPECWIAWVGQRAQKRMEKKP
jgi:hypothetical protein